MRPAAQPQAEPADADAIDDLADHDQRERAGRLAEREHAGRDRGDREAIKDQRGRVVGEALAFEHDEEPPRQARCRAMASGATTSGGATMAPSTKPTAQWQPSRYAPRPPPRRW